jgi:hypothetical protein
MESNPAKLTSTQNAIFNRIIEIPRYDALIQERL